ncbi:hypothetical protein MUG78_07450 [Gordonia alkaliphila]|uniref:2-isopropylmalate synthase LeuA allosteric (dimerisation) domain-containing protein n=1 Tax=Gordonia alkaliphila TaxID=1053547 RepID=A0ABP8ZFE4_9ACTN|nr:hypothetical protein [Gordonia alkaliphila]MCK0439298.1 hypothetical protein [Gordonia alkaliphila]
MSAERFASAFAPSGSITLQHLQIHTEVGDTVRCRATLIVDQRELHLETSAHGTIGAMSEMLYGLGLGVEIVGLYHQNDGAEVTAYLQCLRDGERCWSYGRAATGDEATVHALIAAANQLTGRLQAA